MALTDRSESSGLNGADLLGRLVGLSVLIRGEQRCAKNHCPRPSKRPAHSRSLKNRRIASIEASRMVSCPLSHLSTVERDTPSSREIRAFFHFDCSANLLKRSRTSAFSRSLLSFWVPSIALPLKMGSFNKKDTRSTMKVSNLRKCAPQRLSVETRAKGKHDATEYR